MSNPLSFGMMVDDPLSELVISAALNVGLIPKCLNSIIFEFHGGDRPKISIEDAKKLLPLGIPFYFRQINVPLQDPSPQPRQRYKTTVRVTVGAWDLPVFIKIGKNICDEVHAGSFLSGGLLAPKPLEAEPVLLGNGPAVLVKLLM